MGINGSIEADTPFNEHFYGLVNFGNTCYVNSVLQALYFCKPFREKIIQYKLAYNQRIALLGMVESGGGGISAATAAAAIASMSNTTGSGGSDINSNITNATNMNGLASSAHSTTNSTNGAINGSNTSTAGSNSGGTSSANQVSILKQEHLLNCLAELFYSIVTMKKKKGVMQPKKFIARLRKDNESFDNLIQQDAHEFLNYLLNTCADILNEELKELKRLEEVLRLHEATNGAISGGGGGGLGSKFSLKAHRALNSKSNSSSTSSSSSNFQQLPQQTGFNRKGSTNGSNRSISSKSSVNNNNNKANNNSTNTTNPNTTNTSNTESVELNEQQNTSSTSKEELTWIHELFQGILVNETKCLNCETSSSKEENFLDLSVDVEQNTSLNHCLQEFSNMEMLCGECKYYCETCRSKQEAEKRMRIKKLPKILALHLKRFKFVGMLNKFKKLTYRVVFPFELRLFNTTEDCPNSDRIYDLVSFVVHCGIGLNRGHYISVVKSNGVWFLFDDETVEKIEVSSFEDFYGLPQDTNKKSDTSYILFYEARQ